MSVSGQPSVLHQPLPGGSEGATVRVEPLLAGEMALPPGYLEATPGRLGALKALGFRVPKDQWVWLPVPAFLVRHPSAGLVLIDTGFHPSVATDPKQNLGRFASRFFPVRVTPEQAIGAQLRERSVNPRDVSVVVLTHLHFDHASGISEFAGSTFVVGDLEWRSAAADRRPWLHGYRHAQFDFAFDYRAIDYDRADISSFASFGRSFDLFGDGSVRLVLTPGHTMGHQSVILRLTDRLMLLTGDAVYLERHLDGAPAPYSQTDPHHWRRSLSELQLFRKQYPDAVIAPGHDPDFWQEIEKSYA